MPATNLRDWAGRQASAPVFVADRQRVETRVFRVELLGRYARAALAAESAWSVLAVFRRSVYCRAARGSVVCVGSPSLGAGPLNVLAPLPSGSSWGDLGVTVGTHVASDGRTLRFEGRRSFSYAQTPIWQAAVPPADWDRVALSAGLDALAAECRQRAPADGLAPAVLPLPARRSTAEGVSGWNRALQKAAAPGLTALRTWLASVLDREDAGACPPRTVASLVGLGPGLTPSGDDLLGGVLIALRALGWSRAADAFGSWLLPRARVLTHAISYAHLVCAAGGEGVAALHDTLVALASPGAPGLSRCVDALTTIGHSSGWDALAGMTLVASAAALPRSPDRRGNFTPPVCLSQ